MINNLDDLLQKVDHQLAKQTVVTFSPGNAVAIRALTVHEFEQINDLYGRYGGTTDDDGTMQGNLFTVCSIVRAVVHVETGERLFTDNDVPRIRDELSFGTFRQLVRAFDTINGATPTEADDEPVKKLSEHSLDTENSSTA